MSLNLNAGYGSVVANSVTPSTTGKTFFAILSTATNLSALQDLFTIDNDGVQRVYTSLTSALAACVAGRWDVVVISSDLTTAPTDTELGSAGTKGVRLVFANVPESWELIAMTSNKALPATATGSIFTVTGVVEILAIVGVVTTSIQAQACNAKIATVSNSATTDVCANLDLNAAAAQDRLSITGTFANAMIKTAKGVPVARQATSFIAQEGTIALITGATNTGNVRWMVRYKPLQEGSRIVAA